MVSLMQTDTSACFVSCVVLWQKGRNVNPTQTGAKDPVTPTTPIDPARLGRRERAKDAVMSGGLLVSQTILAINRAI